jgi:heme-degrading monooxygenase HmoA|tara:strand:+ start:1251 stop:1922 length:672 start_codon:yes stop_codon:yes gene_type:complete
MTSIIFFKFNKNLWWAFKQMGMHKTYFENIDGLIFYKMLGTGSSPGFSMYPDFSTYALLLIWEDKLHADKYFKSNMYYKILKSEAYTYRKILLSSFKSVGLWDGINPFQKSINDNKEIDTKVAVLTRATINFNKLIHFWKSVKSASNAISSANGVSFFKGIGELPFIQQATFSIWDSENDINNFAYKNINHKNIIDKTRTQKWYKEDLFVRFYLLNDSGYIKS